MGLFITDWTDRTLLEKNLIDLFKQVGFGYAYLNRVPLIFNTNRTGKVSDGEKSFMASTPRRNDTWYYGDLKITNYVIALGTITDMNRLVYLYSLGQASTALGFTVLAEVSRTHITAVESLYPAAGVALDRVTLTLKDVFFNDVTSYLAINAGAGGTESVYMESYFCGYQIKFS